MLKYAAALALAVVAMQPILHQVREARATLDTMTKQLISFSARPVQERHSRIETPPPPIDPVIQLRQALGGA